MEKFYIVIATLPDRELPVAEIVYENVQWAEISQEKDDKLVVQFYSHPRKKCWEFSYQEAIVALEKAGEGLLQRRERGKDTFLGHLFVDPPDPEKMNEEGQKLLESILHHPERKDIQYNHKLYGPVIEVEAPVLGGARFTADQNEMLGFFDPPLYVNYP